MTRWLSCAALLGALVSAEMASGHEPDALPAIHGEFSVELQHDRGVGRVDSDLFATVELGLRARLSPAWSLETDLVLEPVRDPEPGESRVFEDHGLVAESLVLRWQRKGARLRGGKLTPRFGIAWERAPGIYGADFAEDYELSERIGFEGGIALGLGTFGEHAFTASVFAPDAGFASGAPSTFALAVDGSGFPWARGLSTHVAFLQRASGHGSPETGLALGISLERELPRGFWIEPLVELVTLESTATGSVRYATFATELRRGGVSLAASFSSRDRDEADARSSERLGQLSLGYELDSGLGFALAFRRAREDGRLSNGVGFQLSYRFGF